MAVLIIADLDASSHFSFPKEMFVGRPVQFDVYALPNPSHFCRMTRFVRELPGLGAHVPNMLLSLELSYNECTRGAF